MKLTRRNLNHMPDDALDHNGDRAVHALSMTQLTAFSRAPALDRPIAQYRAGVLVAHVERDGAQAFEPGHPFFAMAKHIPTANVSISVSITSKTVAEPDLSHISPCHRNRCSASHNEWVASNKVSTPTANSMIGHDRTGCVWPQID